MTKTPDTPKWVQDAVFYQIFPDRFAKSGRVEKPNNILPWDAPPHQEKYHGGDLLGIVEKLDYLQDLGINAIYLNPIFQSACNHRYHTHDYYQVDPLLGGNPALRELIDEMHRRGMRIMLDGVFNHASRGFFQFNDILENGPHSAWLDWFTIEGWPLGPYRGDVPANYVGWVGLRALPKFNTDNPQVREYLMRVAEFWLREYDIDGWRLDVASEIKTPGFWEEFRQRVRAIKPDAYIVSEIWELAPEWVNGDKFDAHMNYPFTSAITAFAGGERVSHMLTKDRGYHPYPGIDAAEFGRQITHLLDAYHWETTQVKYNQLDSHDTPRLQSVVRGDKGTVRLATLFQMCYPGAPSIYYGDEIAISGTKRYDDPHEDKDARWPFPWHDEARWDREMLAFFKEVIALRHAHPALRQGSYHQLYAQDAVYVFARQHDSETLLIALNTAERPQTVTAPLNSLFSDAPQKILFGSAKIETAADQQITMTLPSRSGVVLTGE